MRFLPKAVLEAAELLRQADEETAAELAKIIWAYKELIMLKQQAS
jgi:hypothetical protein